MSQPNSTTSDLLDFAVQMYIAGAAGKLYKQKREQLYAVADKQPTDQKRQDLRSLSTAHLAGMRELARELIKTQAAWEIFQKNLRD